MTFYKNIKKILEKSHIPLVELGVGPIITKDFIMITKIEDNYTLKGYSKKD